MRKTILLVIGILLAMAAAAIPIQILLTLSLLPPKYGAIVRMTSGAAQAPARAAELTNIQSSMVLSQVVSNLGLSGKWAEKYREPSLPPNIAFGLLRRDLTVVHESGLIEIRVVNDRPDEAAAIANEIAEVYRASSLAIRGPDGKSASEIVERAQPNMRPVQHRKLKGVLIAGGMGFILAGIGTVLIVTAMRGRKIA